MKRKSLFRKSMVLMLVPIIILSIVLIFVSKAVIQEYFREDSYKNLHRELTLQRNNTEFIDKVDGPNPGNLPQRPDEQILRWSSSLVPQKSVQTSLIIRVAGNNFKVIGDGESIESFELEKIIDNTTWPLQGESTLESETIFYSIVPFENTKLLKLPPKSEVYQIAYISEQYSAELSKVVINIFLTGFIIFIIIISSILLYVFKHMTKRLTSLEMGSSAIGKGVFKTRLNIEPYDEIGRLGDAMNRMSKQLELIQEEQADQFQMISHELKTPIMVMQGYLDALIHEQYPNGTKEASYKVLNEELFKLEKLTQDIIILNKLDYLSKNNVEMSHLSLAKLFEEASERMNLDDDINIKISGEMAFVGDRDSWIRVIENLLSNNLRYAKAEIIVELSDEIRIKNDGPEIEAHLLSKIKKPFVKGHKGGSGLGLTIMTNILNLYHFSLEIKNCETGVAYIIKPNKETEIL